MVWLEALNGLARSRVPVIMQADMTECGLACIAMVAARYGRHEDLACLRRRHGNSSRGASLAQLMAIAGDLQLNCRALRCETHELATLQLPAVLHWGFNHFVVLTRITRHAVEIQDPAVGLRQCLPAEVEKHFTGVALECRPGDDFTPADNRSRLSLRQLMGRLPGFWPVFLQVLVFSVMLQIFALASPFYLQLVVDDVLIKADTDLLILLALGFGLIALLSAVTRALRDWVSIYLTNQLSVVFGSRLFQRLLSLAPGYFANRHIGDIASRFGSIRPVQDFLCSSAIAVVLDGIMALTTLCLLFVYSPLLAAVVLLVLTLYLLVQVAFYPATRRRGQEQLVAEASLESNFMESIRAIDTIKRFGAEQRRINQWQNHFNEALNAGIRTAWLALARDLLVGCLSGLSLVLIIYLGAQQVLGGQISIGMLFAFMAYRRHLDGAVTSLANELINYLMLFLHLERLSDIYLAPAAPKTPPAPNYPCRGALTLKNIRFRRTDTDPWMIDDLSLNLGAGERLCILGPSGCGKSTLLSLMQNLQAPCHGELALDSQPMHGSGGALIKHRSASVMQTDTLLAGSIASNISFNDPEEDLPGLQRAAQLALIDKDIMSLPMGYDSLVGDLGSSLSAGQQSRLLLARALYRQPRVVFLDECTAHLDATLERRVMQSLCNLGITLVFVTHNPALTHFATQILRLGTGPHELHVSGPIRDPAAKHPA